MSMKLPDFIIAGAMKCGTTAVHDTIKRHPDIFMPRRKKEIHYFSEDFNFSKGLSWYSPFFEPASEGAIIGQTCPEYLFSKLAAQRIAKQLPRVKLVFILRDPVERAWSHYFHNQRKGFFTKSFKDALENEARLGQDSSWEQRKRWGLLGKGLYHKQLCRFSDVMYRESLLLISSNQLKNNPQLQFDRLCDFLCVPRNNLEELTGGSNFAMSNEGSWTPRFRNLHRLRPLLLRLDRAQAERLDRWNRKPFRSPPLPGELRRELWPRFAGDAARLERDFEFDIGDWKIGAVANE